MSIMVPDVTVDSFTGWVVDDGDGLSVNPCCAIEPPPMLRQHAVDATEYPARDSPHASLGSCIVSNRPGPHWDEVAAS